MIKKVILCGTFILLAACANLSQYTIVDSNASTQTKMRACLISEANNKFQAGSLFTGTISATSEELVNTCLKKLALEAAGISEESQSTAATIISNLKNLGITETD